MKALFALALLASLPAAAADVAVSVSIGDPHFYGRIEIGSYPPPRLIFPQPLVIVAIPAGVVRHPLYLRVPPGHERHWDKHCAKYDACGHPVYFVRDDWYTDVYAPAYREKHPGHGNAGGGHGKDKHKDKHKDKGKGRG